MRALVVGLFAIALGFAIGPPIEVASAQPDHTPCPDPTDAAAQLGADLSLEPVPGEACAYKLAVLPADRGRSSLTARCGAGWQCDVATPTGRVLILGADDDREITVVGAATFRFVPAYSPFDPIRADVCGWLRQAARPGEADVVGFPCT